LEFRWALPSVGWLKEPKDHLLPLVLGGIVLFLRAADHFCVIGGDLCVDEGFCQCPRWRWKNIGAYGRMAALVADDQSRKGRIRRLHRNEDLMAIGAGIVVGIATLIWV
jgi:hypothetical protein